MRNSVDYDWKTKQYTLIVGDRDFSFNCDGMSDIEALSLFAKALEYAESIGEGSFLSRLEDWAQELAEECEIPFTYMAEGKERTYTPASMWEASGGCEWEESAQYGYDYGWNI